MRKNNYNKRIIKTAVVTVFTLTAISAGVIYGGTRLKNKKNTEKLNATEVFASPEAINTTAVADTSELTTTEISGATDTDAAMSSDTASSTNAVLDVATTPSVVPAGKVLPPIESIISGGKVNKVVPKPDPKPGQNTTNPDKDDANSDNDDKKDNKPTSDNPEENQHTDVGTSALTTDADYQTVDGSYFDDAAFIGNSRTEGLLLFTDISGINLAYTGLNVSSAYNTPAINVNGSKVSVMEAMPTKKFSKAYIMFGVNEVGWMDTDTFISYYRQIITDVKASHPKAIVYVQSMLPVTAAFEAERGDITNKKIANFNKHLRALADEQGAYFLNIAECVADSKGYLPGEASPDGYHLNATYCDKWYSYLKSHAIVK